MIGDADIQRPQGPERGGSGRALGQGSFELAEEGSKGSSARAAPGEWSCWNPCYWRQLQWWGQGRVFLVSSLDTHPLLILSGCSFIIKQTPSLQSYS